MPHQAKSWISGFNKPSLIIIEMKVRKWNFQSLASASPATLVPVN
jgi:hypothetical protein